jgi:phosphoribosylanthranilate isomerase
MCVRPDIKFCGLTRAADAAFGASLGARFLGVIFAESPRQVTSDKAREVFASLSQLPASPRRVGVFSATTLAQIAANAKLAQLDVIQLHGDPTAADVRSLRGAFGGEIWAARRISGDQLPDDIEVLAAAADRVLLDTRAANGGPLGGTGQRFDWGPVADRLKQRAVPRLVLAGGLTPDNVAVAIELFGPTVVDVSSGVESAPGVKDHNRMREFAQAVRAADK